MRKRLLSLWLVFSLAMALLPVPGRAEEIVQTPLPAETEDTLPLCAHEKAESCAVCRVEQGIEALPTAEQWLDLSLDEQLQVMEDAQAVEIAFRALSDSEQNMVGNLDVLRQLRLAFSGAQSASDIPDAYPVPALTGNPRQDIVNIARSQLGYTYAGGTVYGQWWNEVTNWGVDYAPLAWCGMFACWCADQANAGLNIAYDKNGASTRLLFDWYKQYAVYDDTCTTTPMEGDFLFFTNDKGVISHVAIVEAYDQASNTITFIGGNQSRAVTRDTVRWKKGAAWGTSYVYGYGRPNYIDTQSDSITLFGPTVPSVHAAGTTFRVKGIVTSGKPITQVTVGVCTRDGSSVISRTAYPNAQSFDLSALDSYLRFGELKPGVYSYRVSVTNTVKTQTFDLAVFPVLSAAATILEDTYGIVSAANTSLALELTEDGLRTGVQDFGVSQTFRLQHRGNGYYSVGQEQLDRYWTAGSVSDPGVYAAAWSGSDDQLWQILPVGETWCLVPKTWPENCLDIPDGVDGSGKSLQLRAHDFSDTQLFVLKKQEQTHTHDFGQWQQILAPTCTEQGRQERVCSLCDERQTRQLEALGHIQVLQNVVEPTASTPGYSGDLVCERCQLILEKGQQLPATGTVPMYRLYNPYTNEHLFLTDTQERSHLIAEGWKDEGIGWNGATSGDPVYRMYNPYGDFHFYTKDLEEAAYLVTLGWKMDGTVSWDAGAQGIPIYRLFNPYEQINYHHYTTDPEEIDFLTGLGWQLEGVAWYAAK